MRFLKAGAERRSRSERKVQGKGEEGARRGKNTRRENEGKKNWKHLLCILINQRGETGILHGHGITTRKEQEQGQGVKEGCP